MKPEKGKWYWVETTKGHVVRRQCDRTLAGGAIIAVGPSELLGGRVYSKAKIRSECDPPRAPTFHTVALPPERPWWRFWQ